MYNDFFRIGKRGFKDNVVCCFYNAFIGEKLRKELVKRLIVYIFADTVSQGNINAGTFLNGKRTAYNMGFCRVKYATMLLLPIYSLIPSTVFTIL